MAPTLSLAEHQTTPGVKLSPGEPEELRRAVRSLVVVPSIIRPGTWDLTPGSTVGIVQLGGRTVVIRPKLDLDRVLFLVAYALDPKRWQDRLVGQGTVDLLHEAIIPGFARVLRRALGRGLLQGYRTEEATLTTVRGRIRFDDQLRRHLGRSVPVEVRYDDFTEDIEVNRLLKAALHRLGRLPVRSEAARRSLAPFRAALEDGVTLVEYDARRLPDVSWNRLNEHYRPAVDLARLILRSGSIELGEGATSSAAFLLDMNAVFEDFVVVALREALGLGPRAFPQGARGRALRLDEGARIRLEPDVSWWEEGRPVFVGDVKYKSIDAVSAPNHDLYQLLAYTVATALDHGLLIYAKGAGEAVTHEVVMSGTRLDVASLDISGPPDTVLAGITLLAQRIQHHRTRARHHVSCP